MKSIPKLIGSNVAAVADLHDARLEILDNDPGLRVLLSFSRSDT